MKQKVLLKKLEPFKWPVVLLLGLLAALGLYGALLVGLLMAGFLTVSSEGRVAFAISVGVFALPSLVLMLAMWGIIKRKVFGWVLAVVVGIPSAIALRIFF